MKSVAELKNKIFDGLTPDYLLFYGHHKKSEITESCFSQWYQLDFEVDGITYRSMEQYMMAEKSRLFSDSDTLRLILNNSLPSTIKKLGREVKNFDTEIWDSNKFKIVTDGNFAKFSQNTQLRWFLSNTKVKILVEASPYDKIWGIGLGVHDKRALNVDLWQGENLLGFALMNVRERLC